MRKALYIVENTEDGNILRDKVKSELTLELTGWECVEDVRQFDAIILDWIVDADECMKKVIRLRSLCGFRDIPIILIVKDNEISGAELALRRGANSLIPRSFDTEKTLQILKHIMGPIDNKADINAFLIDPFINSTLNIIRTMANSIAIKKDIFVKRNHTLYGDVSGVMGLSGDIEGNIAITFQNDLGYHLVAKMVDCHEAELTPEDVYDGIGEIINIISGAGKAVLNGAGNNISIAIPTVIIGYGHQVAHPRDVPVIVMIFEVDNQPFAVQLCVASKKIPTILNRSAKSKSKLEPIVAE